MNAGSTLPSINSSVTICHVVIPEPGFSCFDDISHPLISGGCTLYKQATTNDLWVYGSSLIQRSYFSISDVYMYNIVYVTLVLNLPLLTSCFHTIYLHYHHDLLILISVILHWSFEITEMLFNIGCKTIDISIYLIRIINNYCIHDLF